MPNKSTISWSTMLSSSTQFELVKWLATAGIIAATISRALDIHSYDLAFSMIGTTLWAYCAYRMSDRPLLFVNAFCGIVLLFGIINR